MARQGGRVTNVPIFPRRARLVGLRSLGWVAHPPMRLRAVAAALALLGVFCSAAAQGTASAPAQDVVVSSANELVAALTSQSSSIELAGPVVLTQEAMARQGLPARVPPGTTLILRGGGA